MAGEAWPIDASSGAPSYTAAELRGIDSTLLMNGTADAFGARGGGRPGAGMVVTASALAWSVTAGAFVAYPRFSATQGPYRVTFQATEAGAYNAPHASFSRRDILSVVIDDAGAGDGSGARQARIVYTAGTAASTPVSPSVPARGTLLATLVVPPSGSPTVLTGPLAVAAGGILPVGSAAEATALTSYDGLPVYRQDVDQLYIFNGTDYLPVAPSSLITDDLFPLAGTVWDGKTQKITRKQRGTFTAGSSGLGALVFPAAFPNALLDFKCGMRSHNQALTVLPVAGSFAKTGVSLQALTAWGVAVATSTVVDFWYEAVGW